MFGFSSPDCYSLAYFLTNLTVSQEFSALLLSLSLLLPPQEFSRKLCSDLGLGGEFVTAVVYSIRHVQYT